MALKKECLSSFFQLFGSLDFKEFEDTCKFVLEEYGTTKACNRFDVGNCIEFAFADLLEINNTFIVTRLPNAKRWDLGIEGYGKYSIKYTSTGDIKLHNSLGENKDMVMKDTFVITPSSIILLSTDALEQLNITLEHYLVNKGDGLTLKRKLLKDLKNLNYPYMHNIDIFYDKNKCKHKQCAEVVYQDAKRRMREIKELKHQFLNQNKECGNVDIISLGMRSLSV